MKIEYDKKADTKYIRIKKGKIFKTRKQLDWLLFDCAKNGDVLGVEILDASKNLVSVITSNNDLVGFTVIESNVVRPIKNTEGSEKGWELNIKSPEYDHGRVFALA